MRQGTTNRRRRLGQGLVLLAFAFVPAVLCQLLAEAPQHRHIHVDSFRYGKEPSVIRCHRGDWLHLTFSTRDTGHSFFLQEFDLDAKIRPLSPNVEVFLASDPGAPPKVRREVVFRAEHPGLLGYLVSKSQYRCHVWCGPMHAFEHGNLIIEPNTLLFAGMGLLVGIPVVGLLGLRRPLRQNGAPPSNVSPTDGWNLLEHLPWLKRLMKWRGLQSTLVFLPAVLLYVVILTTLFGTKMPGRNLGIMLTWVVWLFFLTAVLTPFGGRIWCLACPLPVVGEVLQRGAVTGVRTGSTRGTNNRFFGLNRPWPKWLENAWPRTVAFLILGTFSTALVANPKVSGWLILGLLLLVVVMALVWQLRAFCRYVCPVNAFVGLYSKSAKLALRAANPAICRRCELRWCQRGSEKGWACPYGLCVAEIHENNDCGLCTECIKTCPYDNVALRWRPFAQETRIRTAGEAWLAMTMLVLGAAYCVVHLGHWPALRDYVNILDKGNWHLFGIYAAVLWTAALLGLPAVTLLLAAAGKWLAKERPENKPGTVPILAQRTWDPPPPGCGSYSSAGPKAPQSVWSLTTASAGPLVPIGLLLWIAFVVPMLMVNVTFVLQSLSDPFGWGWDFLGTANTPWRQLWPRAIPWIQVGCVLIGLHYSLRNTWRIWLERVGDPRLALRGMLPMAAMLVSLSGWFVWFFAD